MGALAPLIFRVILLRFARNSMLKSVVDTRATLPESLEIVAIPRFLRAPVRIGIRRSRA